MNKIILVVPALCLLFSVQAGAMGNNASNFTPQVEYVSPQSDSTVDLSGKASLFFSWQQLPIPSGGRDSYKIIIVKEPDTGHVFDKVIDERSFSVEVPANIFENGARYSWHVKQRDAVTMNWSKYYIWFFNVVKR